MPPIQTVSVRAGTTAEWADVTASDGEAAPVLAAGELGINVTTGDMKIGDGVTAFTALPGGAGGTAAFVAAPAAAITGGESPTEAEFNALRGTVASLLVELKAAGLMASS
jgi:hypothetical protein